jgi:hypothetical protein
VSSSKEELVARIIPTQLHVEHLDDAFRQPPPKIFAVAAHLPALRECGAYSLGVVSIRAGPGRSAARQRIGRVEDDSNGARAVGRLLSPCFADSGSLDFDALRIERIETMRTFVAEVDESKLDGKRHFGDIGGVS